MSADQISNTDLVQNVLDNATFAPDPDIGYPFNLVTLDADLLHLVLSRLRAHSTK